MRWPQFIKFYFKLLVIVAAIGAATVGILAYRDNIPQIRIDADKVIFDASRAIRSLTDAIKTEVPLFAGRVSRSIKRTIKNIQTSNDDIGAPLKKSGLLD